MTESETQTEDLTKLSRGDVRARIVACGGTLFHDFAKRRTLIEKLEGKTSQQAHEIACEEYRYHIEDGALQIEARASEAKDKPPPGRGSTFLYKFPTCEKSDFEDRQSCTSARAVDWVFDNFALSDLVATDAPSPGAWGLLCWVRLSVGNLTEFMRTIWPKRLPSRTQVEDGVGGNDDGREELAELDKILDKFGEEETQQQAEDRLRSAIDRTPDLVPAVPGSHDEPDEDWEA